MSAEGSKKNVVKSVVNVKMSEKVKKLKKVNVVRSESKV